MTNEKDSKALGDDKTVMVHKLMCEYIKLVKKHTGESIDLTIKGLTTATQLEIDNAKEYRKKYGINL
jgi:hypothetical protein